jgi:hypothetical protein
MWLYNDKPVDESVLQDYVGFVYIIVNKTDDRFYVGKKLLKFKRTKTIKGRKKKVQVDSDWKTYWGSNKSLQEDVKELSESSFERKILRLCKSKGECNYYELREQMIRDVLLKPEKYYNSYVGARIHRNHVL